MPYTICQNVPGNLPEADPVAVATLGDARDAALDIVLRNESMNFDPTRVGMYSEADEAARNLPAEGAVIGPLPDGYVIDITHVGWDELARLAGLTTLPKDWQKILDAYNGA